MDAYELSNKLFSVKEAIMEDVHTKLEEEFSSYEISDLRGGDIANEVLLEFLMSIATDEKMKSKLVNQVSKKIKEKHKKREEDRKKVQARKLKLFKATGGQIPCLNGCGYHRTYPSFKNFMASSTSGNFICADCSNSLGSTECFKIFEERDVYKIYNIQ